MYTVYECMSRNGTVYSAKCQCKAGLGQACSHVAALLFKLEDLKREGLAAIPEDVTCTGTLQQWHVPPKQDVQAAAVKESLFQRHNMERHQKNKNGWMTKVSQACPKSGLF